MRKSNSKSKRKTKKMKIGKNNEEKWKNKK